MQTKLIDSHCHLDFTIFDDDREKVVKDASECGIEHIIVPSVTRNNWQRVADIKQNYAIAEVAYGLHPMFMKQHGADDLLALRCFIKDNKPIAIGECGLDFSLKELSTTICSEQQVQQQKQEQIALLMGQLKLAAEFSLPVIIHARKSLDLVLKAIRQYPDICGVIHSFSGSQQQAEICIEQGFKLGFGGPITYTRATRLRELVRKLPLQSLLLETDAPDQPDSQHYGQRNVPANLVDIAQVVAEIKECDLQKVAEVTTQNTKELFKLHT